MTLGDDSGEQVEDVGKTCVKLPDALDDIGQFAYNNSINDMKEAFQCWTST
jgi:hypothetical protein